MSEHEPYDLDQQEFDADLRRVATTLAAENEDADFVWLMKGPKGRRFMRRLLEHTGVFRSSFQANSMVMAHREGTKDVGYWLLSQLERLCPESYHTMMQEHRNDRAAVARSRSTSNI